MDDEQRPVLLYDGECGLCHGTVRAVLRLERRHDLLFAPQQSEAGRRLLAGHAVPPDPGTIVLIRAGEPLFRSNAALATMELMGGRWPLLARVLRVIPRPVRDLLYRVVARLRYRIFGTRDDACSLPTPAQRERFLLQ